MRYDAIVIGGGAAGLFCAARAGQRGKRVLVVEHSSQIGRKILISGGGRCNFTNTGTTPENFISKNPHFCKSALARFTASDFVELVKRHRIEFFEKKLGQLFCRDSARLIVELLLKECGSAGVELRVNCRVDDVRVADGFEVETSAGVFKSGKLVVATGGLSFPKIGATDFGYRLARRFGHRIIETAPSLVPLVFAERQNFSKLAGVSIDSKVNAGGNSFRENILFTHRGLSGPAILQASNYWLKGDPLEIDLLPDRDASDLFDQAQTSKQLPANFLSNFLPSRFTECFLAGNFSGKPINQLSGREIDEIAGRLNRWNVRFAETEGYHKAEVTRGGIETNEISSKTMESKRLSGVYFIGEVVDVTGWLGGYNFQWAWSSGAAAGNAI